MLPLGKNYQLNNVYKTKSHLKESCVVGTDLNNSMKYLLKKNN